MLDGVLQLPRFGIDKRLDSPTDSGFIVLVGRETQCCSSPTNHYLIIISLGLGSRDHIHRWERSRQSAISDPAPSHASSLSGAMSKLNGFDS